MKNTLEKEHKLIKRCEDMKTRLYFYKEAGSNFIVVHQMTDDGQILRYACGVNEHGLDIETREGHDTEQIYNELKMVSKHFDFSLWSKFEDEEEEMELTHFETCMGPVEKAFAFVLEW